MYMANVDLERSMNLDTLLKTFAELHPIVQTTLQANRERSRKNSSHGKLENFTGGDFVLVAQLFR